MAKWWRAAAAAVAAAVLWALCVPASATFTGSGTAAMSVGSDTLGPPSGLGLSKRCALFGLFGASMTVTWTASADVHVTGYLITATPTAGNPLSTTVTGRTTTQTTMGVMPGAQYTVTVVAQVARWTSTPATGAITITCGLIG